MNNWNNDNGFNTAILTYRLQPYGRKDALLDIQRAIRLIRARKDEFDVSDKVICIFTSHKIGLNSCHKACIKTDKVVFKSCFGKS